MEKFWKVELELHGKNHTTFVKAESEMHAIMEARTVVKDVCNIAHIKSVDLSHQTM